MSADLKMPLSLFGGGLGLLGNKIFAKIFGDYGVDGELERYYATGLGIDLPFGSDMVGGSTVILSQLTLLVGLSAGRGRLYKLKTYILLLLTALYRFFVLTSQSTVSISLPKQTYITGCRD